MTHERFVAATLFVSLAACGPSEKSAEPAATQTPPAPETTSPSYAATPAPGEDLPPSQTTGPIPLEFRHVWAVEAKDCTAEPALTRISISPAAIRWYEGRSIVVSAEAPHQGAASLQVDHMAEGQTSRETHVLALDEAGATLTYNRNGSTFTYKRCD